MQTKRTVSLCKAAAGFTLIELLVVIQSSPLIGMPFNVWPAIGVLLAVILIMLLWIVVLYRRLKA
ncbi:MAG: type II secretion system protein, partial [Limisphaerales bacterium]